MVAKDILVASPSMEWAHKKWEEAYKYIMEYYPAGTLQVRKLEIVIGDEGYRIRFISYDDWVKYTKGFVGTVINHNDCMDMLKSIINEVVKHDKHPPIQTEGLRVLVICEEGSLPKVFEDFIAEISNRFDSTIVRRRDWSFVINEHHKIGFCYLKQIEYGLREYGDIIFTEESFEKYKYEIIGAMK